MDVIKSTEEIKSLNFNSPFALVPTMGNIHSGHLALIAKARATANRVVVSIYVNPSQFKANEDFDTYPRTFDSDLDAIASDGGCDAIYAPNGMYHTAHATNIVPIGVALPMEGKSRPHFFRGVATVVFKLFTHVPADFAIFGEKDFQQLILIKALVKKQELKVNIVGCGTIREDDGLAMSSRNKLLNNLERKSAANVIRLLKKAKKLYKNSTIEETKINILKDALMIKNFNLEYFEILDISELSGFLNEEKEIRAFIACKVGNIRLIDNITI